MNCTRSAETVSLGVNRPEEATQALTQLGWSVHHNGNRYLHIPVKRRDEPARLNAQLVGLGFEVDHLSLDLPSLEEIFWN
ncbi:MAG: hypothetical protein U0559_08060 [Anaerolineae bacterium]